MFHDFIREFVGKLQHKEKMHILTIGLFDQNTKKQEITKEDAIKIICEIVGDSTIKDAWGYYTHDDGSKVLEPSLEVNMLFKDDKDIQGYIDNIKVKLNQESIVHEFRMVNSRLA